MSIELNEAPRESRFGECNGSGLTVGLAFAVRDCVRRAVLSPIWP